SQWISSSVSGRVLSRLTWMSDTASGMSGVPAGGQVRAAERGGQQFGQGRRAAGRVDEERGPAGFKQELTAPDARQQRCPVSGDDRDSDEPGWVSGGPSGRGGRRGVQGRHQAALSAQ